MIAAAQWQTLANLKPKDFITPDKLDWSIVSALDHFVTLIRATPKVISDYRVPDPDTPSRHPTGRAVDTVWYNIDPVYVFQQARAFSEFDGVGIYVNESGGVSLHLDTTGERTTWGGIITRTVESGKEIAYTTADAVIELIRKKPVEFGLVGLVLVGLLLYLLFKK
jgi:hypothetical protein